MSLINSMNQTLFHDPLHARWPKFTTLGNTDELAMGCMVRLQDDEGKYWLIPIIEVWKFDNRPHASDSVFSGAQLETQRKLLELLKLQSRFQMAVFNAMNFTNLDSLKATRTWTTVGGYGRNNEVYRVIVEDPDQVAPDPIQGVAIPTASPGSTFRSTIPTIAPAMPLRGSSIPWNDLDEDSPVHPHQDTINQFAMRANETVEQYLVRNRSAPNFQPPVNQQETRNATDNYIVQQARRYAQNSRYGSRISQADAHLTLQQRIEVLRNNPTLSGMEIANRVAQLILQSRGSVPTRINPLTPEQVQALRDANDFGWINTMGESISEGADNNTSNPDHTGTEF